MPSQCQTDLQLSRPAGAFGSKVLRMMLTIRLICETKVMGRSLTMRRKTWTGCNDIREKEGGLQLLAWTTRRRNGSAGG